MSNCTMFSKIKFIDVTFSHFSLRTFYSFVIRDGYVCLALLILSSKVIILRIIWKKTSHAQTRATILICRKKGRKAVSSWMMCNWRHSMRRSQEKCQVETNEIVFSILLAHFVPSNCEYGNDYLVFAIKSTPRGSGARIK